MRGRATFYSWIAVVLTGLNLTGFCYSDLRWRSEREYVDAAIAHVLPRTSTVSVDAFRTAHPDCCRVFVWSEPNSLNWLWASLFNFRVIVQVQYDYFGASRWPEGVAFVMVEKCGATSFTTARGD